MEIKEIKKIGIVGGGASALMLCIEAAKLGISTTLLDPDLNCIGAKVATEHMVAAYTNDNIKKLSLRVDAVIVNTKLNFELNTKLHSKIFPDKEAIKELSQWKNILDLLEVIEVPTSTVYYQDNKNQMFGKIEELSLPFRLIKQYKMYSEELEVYTKEQLSDFILEMSEQEAADSFILQAIPEYKYQVICLGILDEEKKAMVYDPLYEEYDEEKVCNMKTVDFLPKATIQKLVRYTKKILKELGAPGAFTIKYGIKANKGIEFINMTPEISLSGLLTLEAYEISIYEQYMHLLLGMKLKNPELQTHAHGMIKPREELQKESEPCHIYTIGHNHFCIKKDSTEK